MTGQPRSLPDDLATLIAMPTVSGPPPDRAALTRAASWLARQLKTLGAEHVALRPTADAPIVLGERTGPPDAPTVLCYGHFDVVPPGPHSSWSTPPFAGIHRAGQIYGRGAADDKGPLLAQLHAARTSPDVRWKFLYDGAEEIGSPTLAPLLRRLRPWLADVDTVLICDTEATTHGHPTLTTSLRGQLTIELLARRHGNPLHPGRYGGAVPNPAQAIAALIASLHHTDGTIAIPGFTDNIRELPMLNTNDLTHRLAPLAQPGWGDPGYTPAAQITVRPALTVTALLAGPCDPAAAHAIPATARATIDIRLVPDQRPQTIYRQLTHHIAHHTPAGIALNIRRSPAVPPWASPTRHGPATTAMTAAVHDIWGTPPTVIRSGGTIPAVTMLTRAAPTAEIILLGLTLPSDNAHAPDEHVGIHQLQKAAATITRFTQRLARAGQR